MDFVCRSLARFNCRLNHHPDDLIHFVFRFPAKFFCRLGSIALPDHDLGRPEQRLINHRMLSPIKAYRVESRRHKILQLPGLARCNNKIFR